MHAGQAFVKGLERHGIDTIVASPGPEWPLVWEALADSADQGITRPGYNNCYHKVLAEMRGGRLAQSTFASAARGLYTPEHEILW